MICLVSLLSIAVFMDIRSFKIKNQLILFGFLLGFIFLIYDKSWTSFLDRIGGVILPIIIFFPMFKLKALGAGDIKLFSLIGLFYGSKFVLQTMLYSLFIAGIFSVIYLIKSKQFYERFEYLILYVKSYYINPSDKTIKPYYDIKKNGYKGVIHYSIAIFLACIVLILNSN